DVGSHEGTEYLVMEYLEGETLAARLVKGPLPLEQTLRFGIEIVDALDKAHRQGIVHRDLKPGNVMLTKSGVKLLDFGLAKALPSPGGRGGGGEGLSALPTQQGLTQEGTILGTFQYMAPEQLEGGEADARSDIFAFGAVLYEMATGRKAFSGKSQASLISAIMKEEPAPISSVSPLTPPALERVVRSCLAKDPEDRWQSAHDVAKELKWIAEGSAASLAAPAAVTSRRRNRERLAWGIAAVAVAAAATAFAVFWLRPPRPPLPLRKLEIPVPQLNVGIGQPLRLSPDGARVAYVAGGRLRIRELAQLEAREVPGSEGAVDPFWSPDGAYLGFAAQSKLWKYPVAGGDRTSIADLPAALSPAAGIDWGSDDRIVFTTGFSGLIEVPAQGGRPTALLDALPKTEADFHQPSLLPGGRGVLFVVHRVPQGSDTIDVFTGKTRKRLVSLPGERLFSPVYAATGHLIFGRARASGGVWAASGVWAVPFSPSKLEVTGAPFLVAQDSAFPSVASDGTLAFLPQTGLPRTQLVWVDRGGQIVGTLGEPAAQFPVPAISPDGSRVAIPAVEDGKTLDVWIQDVARGSRSRLTFEAIGSAFPAGWSPSGDRLVLPTGPDQTGTELLMRSADGTGEAKRLAPGISCGFSPDGKRLVYSAWGGTQNHWDLWSVLLDGTSKPVAFLEAPGNQIAPALSPDGRYLAYASEESGRWEIFLRPFPSGEGKWQVSSGLGWWPHWSRGGDELFYAQGNDIMVVDVKTAPSLTLSSPRKLFSHAPSGVPMQMGLPDGFDVSPDGKRFLLLRNEGKEPAVHGIIVVQNWLAEFQGKQAR
ncbi:MAG TPA: protein kinase, partial [Thermoanaerobaculia bacterium]|nr:protein kinase [Thermoanaerobaculia bacterium]